MDADVAGDVQSAAGSRRRACPAARPLPPRPGCCGSRAPRPACRPRAVPAPARPIGLAKSRKWVLSGRRHRGRRSACRPGTWRPAASSELVQELGEALRVDAPQRRVRGRRPLARCAAGSSAGPVARETSPRASRSAAAAPAAPGGSSPAPSSPETASSSRRQRSGTGHLLGGLDRDARDPLQLPLRVVEQRLEVGHAPPLRRQALEVVEHRAGHPHPLHGHDLGERLPPARLRQPGTSGSDHAGPSQSGRSRIGDLLVPCSQTRSIAVIACPGSR